MVDNCAHDGQLDRTDLYFSQFAFRISTIIETTEEVKHLVDQAFPHHQQGRIDFNTVNPSLSAGKDLLIHSL